MVNSETATQLLDAVQGAIDEAVRITDEQSERASRREVEKVMLALMDIWGDILEKYISSDEER